jgi:hypothetical protein
MIKYLLVFFFFFSFSVVAQTPPKEFEGKITYKTTIILKDKNLDLDELYKVFGRERTYYFKAGKFKWAPQNVRLEFEIFNPKISEKYIIDKFHSNDTLYFTDATKIPDSVISVKKTKPLKILNIKCHSAVFTIMNKEENSVILRTIYYPIDTLTYANHYYTNFKAMGQNFIARYTNSLPLRLELNKNDHPFSIIYEATSIEWMLLNDNEFQINESLPIKK